MREIKFRAWDIDRKKMISLREFFESDLSALAYASSDGIITGKGHVEFMQYTELKDKNGKEIYEGDIVRLSDMDNARKVVVVFNHHQAAFMFREISYYKDTEDFMHASYSSELHPDRVSREVIGNIYENPELLRGEDNE